ncbi:MAG: tRNA (adenosine(37)-N6)-dimethylallyltransferase MiaA [Bacteroidota bacterium]|nr:tRNA (adenosine(37)-N6)-dimethylallyltransferase MiaA [Candidatus Kapabacteria bacterium]MDW8221256.1 tRNA (adenosine(37)-N6)-dimethylallyltransferase MiaA [Bacteroidota bacterium]
MSPQRPDVIAIVGATASGKTATSLELAFLLGLHNDFAFPVEIISADSRQVYRLLDIGTAKPSLADRAAVPHHFIDERNPDETFSAGDFAREASERIADIRRRGNIPIIVGGAGLYIQALTEGFFDDTLTHEASLDDATQVAHLRKKALQDERLRLQQEYAAHGIQPLVEELRQHDPISAQKYADGNPRRIMRALEYYRATGMRFSEAHQQYHKPAGFTTRFFGIHVERSELYRRINIRSQQMFDNGLLEETAVVLARGYSPNCNALNTVGYKEAIACLHGHLSKTQAIEQIQLHTRQYAKRQLTWFRRSPHIEWLTGTPDSIAHEILTRLRNPF